MNRATVGSRWNLEMIEAQYQLWKSDPASVDGSWNAFFEGYQLGADQSPTVRGATCESELDFARLQAAVTRLIIAYREIGHYLADLDPLKLQPRKLTHELLDLSEFGLSRRRPRPYLLQPPDRPSPRHAPPARLGACSDTYCRTIGVEFMHIRDPKIRDWLIERMEPTRNRPSFDLAKKRRILWKLNAAELFETLPALSLRGPEAVLARRRRDAHSAHGRRHRARRRYLQHAGHRDRHAPPRPAQRPHQHPRQALRHDLQRVRGQRRQDRPGRRRRQVSPRASPPTASTTTATSCTSRSTPNPSHLEAVNPVVEGRIRAKQRHYPDKNRSLGMPILIHGDAAFSGQGLVAETLNLSELTGYKTGGTVHIIVNNQIGFTTAPSEGRSSRYCTDMAKMIEVPIFHVNAEDPEAVVWVAEMALDFRQTFEKDVVIDMVCYRRHGHNEGDEPAFTQPIMYKKIKDRPTIKELYTEFMILRGDLSVDEAETIAETFREKLTGVYNEVHDAEVSPIPAPANFDAQWSGLQPHYNFDPVETGVPYEHPEAHRRSYRQRSRELPPQPEARTHHDRAAQGRRVRLADRLALRREPRHRLAARSKTFPVRLSGQDSRRGTFSQRHAVLVDLATGENYIPLNHISPDQAGLCIYNSSLSEAAVLGFDYGYSLEEPHMLIMWEAQFGDFSNGAQVIIDQFIASGESKWGRASGVVLLLPHGYEGQGPEHSSARLERFLQLCAEDNIQVVNCTTPAQYFHLLRGSSTATSASPWSS